MKKAKRARERREHQEPLHSERMEENENPEPEEGLKPDLEPKETDALKQNEPPIKEDAPPLSHESTEPQQSDNPVDEKEKKEIEFVVSKREERINQRATRKEEKADAKAEKHRLKEEQKALKAAEKAQKNPPPRTPDIENGHAMRLTRKRKRAAKELNTPDRNHTGLPHKKRPVRATLLVLLSLTMAAGVTAFFAFNVPNWQQLDIGKITAAPQTGRMYDDSGALIMTIKGAENRVVLPFSEIPPLTRQVFIAAEDLRFYNHKGIDVVRLFGAVVANLKEGGYAQGASTITMQLIRQSHLSTQKTIARKLEEMYLAIQLENRMSKDEILAMYLNYIYFGNGAYGIQAAAQTYFGVDAKDLSLNQTAALAASIKAPSHYAPHVSAENNRSRRKYILNTMLSEGMIDQATHDTAAKETLVLAEAVVEDIQYGWYADAALDEAESILGMSSEQVLSGGLTIDTALSRTHQDLLDKQFTTDVFPQKASDGTKVQGAAACVDVKTGEVMAIVGGRSYDVRRGFNRATQLRRSPGSSLKPLVVFAPAIDKYGYMTASVLKDEPTNFNGYKPRNSSYTYYGNVSIRTAITNSLNVSTVSLMNAIGVPAGKDYLTKVGIPLDARDDNLALALGSMTYGVSPVQLAAAYAPFANGGMFTSPHFIRKITDPTGRILYQQREVGTRVIKSDTAYLMTSMLQSVTSSGTGSKLSGANTPVAGKTGTVNMTGGGNRDIWMACYNSEIACSFWMGFDEPDSSHKLQGWVSGGDNTATMARNFFKALYQNRDKPQFSKPGGIIALEIDKQAIKWRGEPMLAVDLTPKNYRYTEYFTESNHPTKKSDVWTPPRSPNRFVVGHNDTGYPMLIIQPADTAIYRVQRDTKGESFILTELYGTAGETLYYTDTKAQAGVVYTYRVIPVHAELLNNGILLEGVQAVQVAQANLSAEKSIWDNVKDFFTGGNVSKNEEDAMESMAENQRSIFWED